MKRSRSSKEPIKPLATKIKALESIESTEAFVSKWRQRHGDRYIALELTRDWLKGYDLLMLSSTCVSLAKWRRDPIKGRHGWGGTLYQSTMMAQPVIWRCFDSRDHKTAFFVRVKQSAFKSYLRLQSVVPHMMIRDPLRKYGSFDQPYNARAVMASSVEASFLKAHLSQIRAYCAPDMDVMDIYEPISFTISRKSIKIPLYIRPPPTKERFPEHDDILYHMPAKHSRSAIDDNDREAPINSASTTTSASAISTPSDPITLNFAETLDSSPAAPSPPSLHPLSPPPPQKKLRRYHHTTVSVEQTRNTDRAAERASAELDVSKTASRSCTIS